MIQVENLVKRYKDVVALDHFNLEVKEGEIVGLLGPNGCGKTTLINCILSLLTYDKGTIKVCGETLNTNSYDLKSKIGIVPQEVAVFDNLTVVENIDYFCGLYVSDKANRKALVNEAIAFVGLEDYRKFLPKKLSGGLKRRLNIACGIAHKPSLIFLDEPTVAVDAQSRNFILEGIKNLNEEGATIVYTTHYLDEAQTLCDTFAVMDRGRNVVQGTLDKLIQMVAVKERIRVITPMTGEVKGILEALPDVLKVEDTEGGYWMSYDRVGGNVEALLAVLHEHNIVYTELNIVKPTLNDVFLELTGKELRDE